MKKQLLAILIFLMCGFAGKAQTILGVDVYHGDDPITWSSAKNAGYVFAWCKASQGTTYTDPQFSTNMSSGVTAGEVMGAYDFADPENNTASAEANYFISVAGSYIKAGFLPPVLDLEDPSSGPSLSSAFTSAQLTAWVQLWFTTVQNATDVAPMIYTDGNYANYLSNSLNKYGLWIADPDGSTTVAPGPTYLGSWTTWKFKQYSWNTNVPGVASSPNTDADVFNGDTAAFHKLIGPSTPPPPPVCNTIYAPLPYTTSFENTWEYDSCAQVDQRLPDLYWKSSIGGTSPGGNDYWHRDDYTGGDWSAPTSGAYSPTSSKGTYSARFHNSPAVAASTGALDLYVDLSPAGTKTISFDYIHNETSPSPFSFDVMLSTDGGKTFPTTLLSIPAMVASWTTQSVTTTATSATGVIRFIATDKGNVDVGIDNLSVTNGPAGISEPGNISDFIVYPNPNNGTFNVFTKRNVTERSQLEIFNALGQQVYSGIISPGNTQVNMNVTANGLYFYRITNMSGDKLLNEGKLVLQR